MRNWFQNKMQSVPSISVDDDDGCDRGGITAKKWITGYAVHALEDGWATTAGAPFAICFRSSSSSVKHIPLTRQVLEDAFLDEKQTDYIVVVPLAVPKPDCSAAQSIVGNLALLWKTNGEMTGKIATRHICEMLIFAHHAIKDYYLASTTSGDRTNTLTMWIDLARTTVAYVALYPTVGKCFLSLAPDAFAKQICRACNLFPENKECDKEQDRGLAAQVFDCARSKDNNSTTAVQSQKRLESGAQRIG